MLLVAAFMITSGAAIVRSEREPAKVDKPQAEERANELLEQVVVLSLENAQLRAELWRIDEMLEQGNRDDIPEEPEDVFFFREDVPMSEELQRALHEACLEYGVDEYLMLGLIELESAFDPYAVSKAGCYGLCQLNPRWHPANLSPEENIWHGVEYLAEQTNRYDGDIAAALTAYNAGHDTGNRIYAKTVLSYARDFGYQG